MKRRKKLKGRNNHHLIPLCRIKHLPKSQRKYFEKTLLMDIDKHTKWHQLFGVLTLDEVISLLQRIKRAKAV